MWDFFPRIVTHWLMFSEYLLHFWLLFFSYYLLSLFQFRFKFQYQFQFHCRARLLITHKFVSIALYIYAVFIWIKSSLKMRNVCLNTVHIYILCVCILSLDKTQAITPQSQLDKYFINCCCCARWCSVLLEFTCSVSYFQFTFFTPS